MQIYSLLFGSLPFQYFGDDFLVAQMINLVEDLPSEWQQKFYHMRLNSRFAKSGELILRSA
jgi:hypothetical protein